MAARERNIELKVGLLVLVALALFGGFVFVLGEYRTGDRERIEVDFTTSADLKAGAPVKIAGVTVSKVKDVAFWGGRPDPNTGRPVQVRVGLDLDREMAKTVREDANAFISTLGILGEKYVEIDKEHIQEVLTDITTALITTVDQWNVKAGDARTSDVGALFLSPGNI